MIDIVGIHVITGDNAACIDAGGCSALVKACACARGVKSNDRASLGERCDRERQTKQAHSNYKAKTRLTGPVSHR